MSYFRFYEDFVFHFDDGSHPDVKVVLNRCDAERLKSGGLEDIITFLLSQGNGHLYNHLLNVTSIINCMHGFTCNTCTLFFRH